MKLRFVLLPLASLMAATPSSADIYVLKNGDRLDATLLKETADSYVLDVKITKSIRDEKTVPKAEVAEVIAEKMDETAFEKLKTLVPVPDLTPPAEYDRRLALLSKFIKENPKSPLVKEADAMIATLKEEGAAITAGGAKLDGKLIPPEEFNKDAYDLDAKIVEKRVRDAIARGDILPALRGINLLEREYKYTNSRRAVVPMKAQLLRSYKAYIDGLLSTYDSRVEDRAQNLGRMSSTDRANVEQALADELAAMKKSHEADKASGQIWLVVNEFDKDSLDEAQDTIGDQLDEAFEDNGIDSGKRYRNIYRIIGETTDTSELQDLVYKAEEVDVPDKYLDRLKELAKAKGATF